MYIPGVYTKNMTTAENIQSTVAERTNLVNIATALTGRKASAAWNAVDAADQAVKFATADHERFIRSQMVGATEAEIQKAAQAA